MPLTEKSGASVPHYNKSAEHLSLPNDNDAYESLHMLTVLSTLGSVFTEPLPLLPFRTAIGSPTSKQASKRPRLHSLSRPSMPNRLAREKADAVRLMYIE